MVADLLHKHGLFGLWSDPAGRSRNGQDRSHDVVNISAAGTHDAELPGFCCLRTAENWRGKVMLTSRCMAVIQLP